MAIGFVDITRILEDSKRGKSLMEKLNKVAQRWQGSTDLLEKKLQQANDRLQTMQQSPNPSALFEVSHKMRLYRAELNQLQERAEMDLSGLSEFFREQVLSELHPIIRE